MSKKLTLALACLLLTTKIFATHIIGGEIGYAYNGTNYAVNLTLYANCSSTGIMTGSQTVTCQSTSCSSTFNITLAYTGTDTIREMYCPTSTATCGSSPGYYVACHYSVNTTLSACSDWKISYTTSALNSMILNISNPGSQSLYLEAFLNNSTALNNCAVIKNYPPLFMGTGSVNTESIQNVDADGDSVVSQLIVPQASSSTNIGYSSGYSLSAPFGSGSVSNIDQANQYLQLESTNIGLFYLSMRTNEYRSGSLVGYSTRSWVTVASGSSVKVPLPASTTAFTYLTHPGQTQTITLNFNDSTSTDSVFVSFTPTNTWGYTTSAAPAAGSGSGSITWTTPSTLNPATTPYFYIYVLARNHACPMSGFAWYTILVNTALTTINDSVWAGDANGDNTANMYDPLAIAIAYGQTGPTRSGASIAWTPQYCTNWANVYLPVGLNVKHADCNGDGTVNSSDLAAVTANYGLTHPKGHHSANKLTGVPELYFDLTGIILTPGANISVPIKFGSASQPMNNIYGLAASVEIISTINLAAAPTLTYSTSWIGTTSNTLNFTKNISNNHVDWAYARIDQSNVSGNGTIATLNFTVPATATAGQQMKFHFDMPRVVDKNGNIITAYNADDDSMNVTLGIANVASPVQYVEIVPNPSQSHTELQMFVEKASNMQVKIVDLLGKTIWQQSVSTGMGNQSITLPAANIVPGMYMIQIQGDGWQYNKTLKWIKQ